MRFKTLLLVMLKKQRFEDEYLVPPRINGARPLCDFKLMTLDLDY